MLQVNNIEVSYGNIQILRGLSIDIPARSFITLLGGNGTGKSTLMKSISGLLNLSSGTIEFENKRIDSLRPHQIVEIGITQVPQGKEVFPALSVWENLKIGAYLRRKDPGGITRDSQRIFDYFPVLRDRRSQAAGTLSGGEQQMLAIGRGLMSRPKLLMLDEPSAALSPRLVEEIFRIINQINRDGVTIFLVEQNVTMALSMAQYGYILKDGKIALEDETKNLAENKKLKSFYLD
jgi:branched-chain amino acid transport system ATP-binding protein